MKTKLLLTGLLLLFLSACATSTPPRTATELQILESGVRIMTEPRRVEGEVKTRADARNNGELWSLAGHQEDVIVLSEGDKARVRDFVAEAIQAITLSYAQPCRWWQFGCKAARKKLQEEN